MNQEQNRKEDLSTNAHVMIQYDAPLYLKLN